MLKILFCSIFISLSGIHLHGNAQSGDPFTKALDLFGKGEYFHASIEFERAVFYNTDLTRKAHCMYYKSLCYRNIGEIERALDQLGSINVIKLPDTLFFKIRHEQALCNFLSGNYAQSLWNIDDIKAGNADSSTLIKILPLNILCLNADHNWQEASEVFRYLIGISSLDSARIKDALRDVDFLYMKRKLPKPRSAKKAETLSRFIPGSGQIYCGRVFEGSFNFMMNASLLGFSLYEFYTGYYFTGYVIGLTIFNKTYHGGMHRASYLANEKNKDDINSFNLRTIELLNRISGTIYDQNRMTLIK